MDRKVTGITVESNRTARKVTARSWILAGTTLAAGLVLSVLVVACAPLSTAGAAPSGTIDKPLSVRQTEAAMLGNQVNQDVAAATAWARATDDEAARMEQRNHAVETEQALALQAITITAQAIRSNLALESETISNTLAISEAMAASEAEQDYYADTLKAQEESARIIAEGEATRSAISGWIWFAGLTLVIVIVVGIMVLVGIYVVLWFRSSTRRLQMTEIAHAQALSRALPAGDVWIPFDRDPYRTLIRVGGDLQPAYEFLGLPAPSAEMLASMAQTRDTIPTHGRGGEGELDREPELDPQSRALLEFLKNCAAMRGGTQDRIPPQKHYVECYKVSPNTWQDHVNSLTPQHLEGQGTRGTRIVSRRYKTLEDLIEGVRKGELRPGPARRAPVQADQIEVISAGD